MFGSKRRTRSANSEEPRKKIYVRSTQAHWRLILETIKIFALLWIALALAEWLTNGRVPVDMRLEWDSDIPYIPGFYVIYFSTFLLAFPFWKYITDSMKVRMCGRDLTITILISFLIYVVIPTQQTPITQFTQCPFYIFLDSLTGQNQLFPSLHIALSLIIICYLFPYLTRTAKLVTGAGFFLICASTLITHKHVLLDVVGGVTLALAVLISGRLWPDRFARNEPDTFHERII
jgi:membrane-associated phospholipid phosphatase